MPELEHFMFCPYVCVCVWGGGGGGGVHLCHCVCVFFPHLDLPIILVASKHNEFHNTVNFLFSFG